MDFINSLRIIAPIIAIADFIISIIIIITSNHRCRKVIVTIQLLAVLIIVIIFLFYTEGGAEITTSEPQVVSVEGFHEAFTNYDPGYMTLKIKENEMSGGSIRLECTIIDSGKMRYAFGRFDPEKSTIYIPGFGSGRVEKDQDGKIILKFLINGKEIKFSQ